MPTDSLPWLRGTVYGRMSSKKQDKSVPQQLAWAGPACERERVRIAATFTDEGISGHDTSKRDGLFDMLEYCREQYRRGTPIDVVVCWHSNRFSRADSHETGWYLWEFRKVGVSKMLTSEGWIDFDKGRDRIIHGVVQEASNHQNSIDNANASTRNKLANAREGKWGGGRIPYGYRMQYRPRKEGERGNGPQVAEKLVPHPETADVVRWLFASYATGRYSLRMLVADLGARGVATPSQQLGQPNPAADWTVPTIRGILTNPVYLGHLVWNRTSQGRFLGIVNMEMKDRVRPPLRRPRKAREGRPSTKPATCRNAPEEYIHGTAEHEALVDVATFERCARRLVEKKRNTTPTRGGGDLVLTGLLCCGHCQRRMIGRHNRGVAMYLCGTYLQFGKARCTYNRIPQAELVDALARKLRERFTPEFFDACRQRLLEIAGKPAQTSSLDRLTRRLADLDAHLTRAARRALTEEDEALALTYRDEVKRLQGERDRAAGDLDTARRSTAQAPDPAELIEAAIGIIARLDETLKRGTPAEVRAVLHDHIEKVELWFDREEKGRETHCTFARGLIWLREDSPLGCQLVNVAQVTFTNRTPASTSRRATRVLLPNSVRP